jgi:NADP-dependent 3-hydroxy acid dehydrogenase YdfG
MAPWDPPSLTWLITGASGGFGLALTRIALSHGHKVIATSRDPSRIPDLVAEVEEKGGQWLALDVDDKHTPALVEKLEAQGTTIDVLINNAGRSLHGPAESITEEEVRSQVETLYFGPYRLIRAVVPHMRARRRGMIVNIGSGAGVDGRESMGAYAGGKAAMDGKSDTSLRP